MWYWRQRKIVELIKRWIEYVSKENEFDEFCKRTRKRNEMKWNDLFGLVSSWKRACGKSPLKRQNINGIEKKTKWRKRETDRQTDTLARIVCTPMYLISPSTRTKNTGIVLVWISRLFLGFRSNTHQPHTRSFFFWYLRFCSPSCLLAISLYFMNLHFHIHIRGMSLCLCVWQNVYCTRYRIESRY